MTHDTRERLVRRGVELLTEFSLGSTGLDGLLKSTGVTKGSFYHFFASKQAFALEVIDWYDAYFQARFQRILGDASVPPLLRLRQWVDSSRRGMARYGFRRGCLVGNLSQEVGPHDALISERLVQVLESWQARVEVVLEQAKDAGEVGSSTDTRQLARVFWIGWQGAILCSKLQRTGKPLEEFADFFIAAAVQQARTSTRSPS